MTPKDAKLAVVKIALKVFVILNTDNEAGSAPMIVERPAGVQLAA